MTAYEFCKMLPDEFARELSLIPAWANHYRKNSRLNIDDLSIWAIDFSDLAGEPKVAIALMSESGSNSDLPIIDNDLENFMRQNCIHLYEYKGIALGSWLNFSFTMFRDRPILRKNSVGILATEPSVCIWKGRNTTDNPVVVRLIPECYEIGKGKSWKKLYWVSYADDTWSSTWKNLAKTPTIVRFPTKIAANKWKKKMIEGEWTRAADAPRLNTIILPTFITRDISESGIIPNDTDIPYAVYDHSNELIVAYKKGTTNGQENCPNY